MNARTEQLREQIEKSVKSERRGLKAREVALSLEDSSAPPRGPAPADRGHPRYDTVEQRVGRVPVMKASIGKRGTRLRLGECLP